jgi:hypothetical protein
MIVFIGGMPRSGSTYSFNITREVLGKWVPVHYESDIGLKAIIARAGPEEHVIVKAHVADEDTVQGIRTGRIKSIVTYRNPVDAIASWINTFGFTFEIALQDMKSWIDLFLKIRDHSLLLDYETIDRHRASAALTIAQYLQPTFHWSGAEAMADKHSRAEALALSANLEKSKAVDIGFSYYDPETYLHRRHVSGLVSKSAEELIGAHRVAEIRKALAEHLRPDGSLKYVPPFAPGWAGLVAENATRKPQRKAQRVSRKAARQ